MDPSQTYHDGKPGVFNDQTFAPPPPQSGAGQNQQTSLANMAVPTSGSDAHQSQQGQEYAAAQQQNISQPTAAPVHEQGPPLPQRHPQQSYSEIPPYNPATYQAQAAPQSFPPPPQRQKQNLGIDDPSHPDHYIRDPHKLIAYLVPFPAPNIKGIDPATVPTRFFIWTPPPPPLVKPAEGVKEDKVHMVQRKWQNEVREAKTSDAKLASWKGLKGRATKGIDWAIGKTTSSNLDFLGRVADGDSGSDTEIKDGAHPQQKKKTVGVEEMVLVYPSTVQLSNEQMREEFVNTMMRTKTKAQRDAVIATGLIPVSFALDWLLLFVAWPFGGLGEIDTVWAYSSIRGAKTSRSVTKRLKSSDGVHGTTGGPSGEEPQLRLTFTPSQRVELLKSYLEADCNKIDSKKFPNYRTPPTESQIIEAIGWNPTHTGGAQMNWEDEQWQLGEVKEDIKNTMHKAGKEWDKWCKKYAEDPEKAMKK